MAVSPVLECRQSPVEPVAECLAVKQESWGCTADLSYAGLGTVMCEGCVRKGVCQGCVGACKGQLFPWQHGQALIHGHLVEGNTHCFHEI